MNDRLAIVCDGEAWTTTKRAFLREAAEGLASDEIATIYMLCTGDDCVVGGGAAPLVTVRCVASSLARVAAARGAL